MAGAREWVSAAVLLLRGRVEREHGVYGGET